MAEHENVKHPYYEVTVRLPLHLYSEAWFDRVADAAGDEAATSGSVVPGRACCFTCEQEHIDSLPPEQRLWAFRTFAPCPCGNKRCPRSNHHDNACTGSNESGQPGSAWA